MATFTVGLKGQTVKPHGPGARIVEGEITGSTAVTGVTINAKDIGLQTIHNLHASGYNAGTSFIVKLGTFIPGDKTAANYASVTAYGLGSVAAVNLGTFRVLAVGE